MDQICFFCFEQLFEGTGMNIHVQHVGLHHIDMKIYDVFIVSLPAIQVCDDLNNPVGLASDLGWSWSPLVVQDPPQIPCFFG